MIIGAAFGKIVDSLVGDIFMPIIGAITGGLDFSNYFIPLSGNVTATSLAEAKRQGAVLAWGNFITIAINFIIVAWVLFMVVKGMNRLQRRGGRQGRRGQGARDPGGRQAAGGDPRPPREPAAA